MKNCTHIIFSSLFLISCNSPLLHAQVLNSQPLNYSNDPLYGETELEAGFLPDPAIALLRAGGITDAREIIEGCVGYITSEQPDWRVIYNADDDSKLGFYAESEEDTTLIIFTPEGEWRCNDDLNTYSEANPGIEFSNAKSGTYNIWAGTYSESSSDALTKLSISEISPPWEPLYGWVDLEEDFRPSPLEMEVKTFASRNANSLSTSCNGFIHQSRAHLGIKYFRPNHKPLSFFGASNIDLTLAVETPSKQIICNDDFSEEMGSSPGIIIANPEEGIYRLWLGAYSSQDDEKDALLFITNVIPDFSDEPFADDNLLSSGSGFLVSKNGHVLTNHHVVEECSAISFKLPNGPIQSAELISINENNDLALIKVDSSTNPLLFQIDETIPLGESVVVFGFPLSGALSSQGNLSTGIVSGLSGFEDNLNEFQISAEIQPGNSGGPVFDSKGRVIGVVVSRASDEFFYEEIGIIPQNVNFAIRASVAKAFLSFNNINIEPNIFDNKEMNVTEIATIAQNSTGKVQCTR